MRIAIANTPDVMSMTNIDPAILQSFLSESGELLETLEGDLIALEQRPKDPPRLNQAFRALHTIKGSASFLTMTHLVSIAHASETALEAARNDHVQIDHNMITLLLRAVDTIKRQMKQAHDGRDLEKPDATLVVALVSLGQTSNTPQPALTTAAQE